MAYITHTHNNINTLIIFFEIIQCRVAFCMVTVTIQDNINILIKLSEMVQCCDICCIAAVTKLLLLGT